MLKLMLLVTSLLTAPQAQQQLYDKYHISTPEQSLAAFKNNADFRYDQAIYSFEYNYCIPLTEEVKADLKQDSLNNNSKNQQAIIEKTYAQEKAIAIITFKPGQNALDEDQIKELAKVTSLASNGIILLGFSAKSELEGAKQSLIWLLAVRNELIKTMDSREIAVKPLGSGAGIKEEAVYIYSSKCTK